VVGKHWATEVTAMVGGHGRTILGSVELPQPYREMTIHRLYTVRVIAG
jgi:hypothetical protein